MQNKQVSNPETTNKLSHVIYSSVVLILPENTRMITAEVNVHTLPESDTWYHIFTLKATDILLSQ